MPTTAAQPAPPIPPPRGMPVTTAPQAPPEPRSWGMNALRCPTCNSDQVQSLSVIHQAGTTRSAGLSLGGGKMLVGGGGGPGLLGGALNVGGAQTALAQNAAPPTMPASPHGCYFFAITTAVLTITAIPVLIALVSLDFKTAPAAALLMFWLAVIPITIHLLIEPAKRRWLKRERANFEEKSRNWSKTFMCHRCGQWFYLPS